MDKPEVKVWWAMSAVFNRSMIVKAALDAMSVGNFIPMSYTLQVAGRRKVRKLVPAVRNLIFIHATALQIRELKQQYSYLHYLMQRSDGRSAPIVVPEEQMRHFIAVAGTNDDQLIYFGPEDVDLKAGDRVRIHDGIFEGVEGVFVKVKGTRNRLVVVSIPGVMAVATATIRPDQLEKL